MYVKDFIQELYTLLRNSSNGLNDAQTKDITINNTDWLFHYWSQQDQLALRVRDNGTSYFYNDFNELEEEQGCMTIREFILQEIKQKRIHNLELEKILFELN